MSLTIKNNLQYSREKNRQSGTAGKSLGFEYAIKDDGTILAEELLTARQRRQRTGSTHPYTFISSRVTSSSFLFRPDKCLSSIEKAKGASIQQYQRESSCPPEPEKPLSNQLKYPSNTTSSIQNHPPSLSVSTNRNINSVFDKHPYDSSTGSKYNNTDTAFNKQTTAKENAFPNHSSNVDSYLNNDEDYDALLANMDIDEIVSRRQTSTTMTNRVSTTDSSSTFNAGGGAAGGGGGAGSTRAYQADVNRNNYDGEWDSNRNITSNRNASFDYGDHERSANQNYGSNSNGFGERQDVTTDFYGDNTSSSGLGGPHSSSLQATNNNDQGPLCPGHNLPCRLLTANTEANMGRQFYKCSMPDGQQCEFFEWIDGNGTERNWDVSNDFYGGAQQGGEQKDITLANARVFGHHKFRKNQEEIIRNAMQGKDVFVLMPTGGGKSLCYQLPAYCCPGLAVIISPLLSLIQDQVQSLKKRGIQSEFLSSTQDYQTEQVDIVRRLNQTDAHQGIKLLYITPEKLTRSNQMQGILRRLYNKDLLSRFVVDEAHCLSDWGHDFRPDYNQLDMIRKEFPNVPLMALTATANEKVVNDAIRNLGMRNPFKSQSSFNRENLHYDVRKKDSKVVDTIAGYIAKRPQDSGVIYCLSRKNCEDVAEKLQSKLIEKGCGRVQVSFYHAELDPAERERRHYAWSIGRISVLCATVAFGMGIDKPDVRYVIHYSMPKSITHYYQESGRAGRDGEKADCILYYSYKDKKILENMIRKSGSNPNSASTRRKIDQLHMCVRYCEDECRCRRTMQLEFFGERFDSSNCNETCDNCKAGREPDRKDLTNVAKTILSLLEDLSRFRSQITLHQLSEMYKGSKSKSLQKAFSSKNGQIFEFGRIKGHGAGSKYKKHEIERIVHAMVFEHLVYEESCGNQFGFANDFVRLGENAPALMNGGRTFFVDFPKAQKSQPAKKPASKKANKKKAASSVAKGGKRKSSSDHFSIGNGLQFEEIGDDSDDDDLLNETSPFSTGTKSGTPSSRLFDFTNTKKLGDFIKGLSRVWAQEEMLIGNNVQYWNILDVQTVKSISHIVPTTVEELASIDGLGEQKIADYGDRLIKGIKGFLEKEGLTESFNSKRPAKRLRASKKQGKPKSKAKSKISKQEPDPDSIIMIDGDDDDDEFGTEIDFSAIAMPSP